MSLSGELIIVPRLMLRLFLRSILPPLLGIGLCQCSSTQSSQNTGEVVVSVKDQKLAVYDEKGSLARKYPVSTSKFGINDKPGTYGTPVGELEVVAKIGHGAPAGAVFKNRRQTGEVIKPGSTGRDPIVSRIMWLRGLEAQNKNAYKRGIYIHGTADEQDVGRPVSYGCIRMKSTDVIELFNRVPIGTRVLITDSGLPGSVPKTALPPAAPPEAPSSRPPLPLNPEGAGHRAMTLAQNTASPSAAATSAGPSFERKQLQDGSSVIYSAPTSPNSPGFILRSRRSAGQGLNN